MEVNEMQKWNIANQIQREYDHGSIIKRLEKLERNPFVKLVKKNIPVKSKESTFKIAIIDFEGSPVFLCGIMIENILLTFYIENYLHRDELYLVIFEALKRSKILYFFAFSDYERNELLSMYRFLQVQGYNVFTYAFIKEFPIINLQNTTFESLAEAIYSISLNSKTITTGDSLFRNSKIINKLFTAHKFPEIISHNRNCLINENILFRKRWYKNYKI